MGIIVALGQIATLYKTTLISLTVAGLALVLEHKEQLSPQHKTNYVSICCPKQICH